MNLEKRLLLGCSRKHSLVGEFTESLVMGELTVPRQWLWANSAKHFFVVEIAESNLLYTFSLRWGEGKGVVDG